MKLFAPSEGFRGERRSALVPEIVKKFIVLGFEVSVESGLGAGAFGSDDAYRAAGARVLTDRNAGYASADVVVSVHKPRQEAIRVLKRGALHISFLDPFHEKECVAELAAAGVSAISMEMIPRTTLAQKMDAISSQASLAGYAAVIKAAGMLPQILPMMMTPAGTLSPSRFFIIGVGVAGLQAIATAKRLGARVDAFDTRPVVEEQVRSLGAKFVKIDLGETGQTAQGYAKELTPEQLEKQRQGMAKVCSQSDVIITTAKLFGRKAPLIVTRDMLAGMKPGSVVIDLAAESGGNVEGCVAGEEVTTEHGVRIMGQTCLEGTVSAHASQMYASNLYNLIEHFWDKEARTFRISDNDPILTGCLITHGGHVVHEQFKQKTL